MAESDDVPRRKTSRLAFLVVLIAGVGAISYLVVSLAVFSTRPDLLVGATVDESEVTAVAPNPALEGAGALLDLSTQPPRSGPIPPRTVALTFDDGPDPLWTPRVMEVLDRYDVRATFYVVGQHVTEHPDVARELVERGHEIGNHTYNHARLGSLRPRQIEQQIALTQRAVIGATGVEPTTFRPPYSGSPSFLPPSEVDAAKIATSGGLRLVLSSRSAPDFDPTVTTDQLVAESMPALGTGAVVTLHDGGGGNRQRTVEALEELIPALQAQGYEFVTASQLVGVPQHTVPARAELLLSSALKHGLSISGNATEVLRFLSLLVVTLMVARTAILLPVAIRRRRRTAAGRDEPGGELDEDAVHHTPPPVSVVVPAFNEQDVIESTVRSILRSDLEEVEVIVVDDGSTDSTAERLDAEEFRSVRVLRRSNAGKAVALDAGVRAASYDLVVLIDADTLLEPGTLPAIVRPFSDPSVGAVAGNARVGNRSGILGLMQHVEYAIASAVERQAFDAAGVMLCVPGAIGAFRRSAVLDVGGIGADTLAEDTDLTLAVARDGWKVAYAAEARAWTETPSTMGGLYRQRLRWNYGILQAIAKHRSALTQRGPGARCGRLVLPYVIVMGFLFALIAPAIDLLLVTQLLLGTLSASTVVMWLVATGSTVALGVAAMRFEGERKRSVAILPLQQVVFRQMLYVAVLHAFWGALSGIRLPWNKLERTADASVGGSRTPDAADRGHDAEDAHDQTGNDDRAAVIDLRRPGRRPSPVRSSPGRAPAVPEEVG